MENAEDASEPFSRRRVTTRLIGIYEKRQRILGLRRF